MNEAMAEAIAVGKAKLAAIRNVQAERVAYEQRALRTQLNGKYAVWRKSLEGRLPAWVHELIPAEPSGADVSEWRCTIVVAFPELGDMLFTGVRRQDDERGWDVINIRPSGAYSWILAGEEFVVALGMLADMHEETEARRAQWEREEAEEVERYEREKAEEPAPVPVVDPMDRIAAVLERLADAVEDIAAVAVTLDGVLETAASNMSEVRVWGEEEGEK